MLARRVAAILALGALLALPALAKKPRAPVPPAWRPTDAAAEDHKKGMDALLAKDWAAAEAAFVVVTTAEPDCGLALVGLGRARVMLGRPSDAVAPLQRAAGHFGDQFDPHLWLARAWAESGHADEALAEARAALGIKAGSVDAQRVAQGVLVARADYAGAHAMVAAARAVANNSAWDCFDGIAFAAEGELGKAQAMAEICHGVPDGTLFTEYTRALSEAVARAESAAPPP